MTQAQSVMQIRPLSYIRSLVGIAGSVEREVVVLTLVDHGGWAGDNEVLVNPGGDKTEIPPDLLFGYALSHGAPFLMVTSQSSGPIDCLHERDIDFTKALIVQGEKVGVPLFEHLVVEDDCFRLMSESLQWSRCCGNECCH